MALLSAHKEKIIEKFQTKGGDTGTSQVQVALLTYRIKDLTEHFKRHKKDRHGRLGLVRMVNKRKKLLSYLKRRNLGAYTQLIGDLGLRK